VGFGRCTLGVGFNELFSKTWGFTSYVCNVNPVRACPQPHDVEAGDARGVGTSRGRVDLSIVAPLERDLDLRRGKVTLVASCTRAAAG